MVTAPFKAAEMTYSVQVPRTFVAASLSLLYILGFIISPYWSLHQSTAEVIFYLAVTLLLGIFWVFRSTGSPQVQFSRKDAGLFFMLLAGILLINFRLLNSVIPFRGDEALHLERTLEVVNRIPSLGSLIMVGSGFLFMTSGLLKKQGWMIFVGSLVVTLVIVFFLGRNPFEDMQQYPLFFLRYPFINYWFLAALPKLVSLIATPYYEILYRVIPVLSMIGIAWLFLKRSGVSSLMDTLAWGLAVATIPLVFYYSSILYLEPPAVLLMTIVCLDINNLLYKNSNDISKLPGWYALILIGFIKETTIPFLLCFIVIRLIVQWRGWYQGSSAEKSKKTWLNLLAGELGVAFILLAPAFLYLYFRATLTSTRTFDPNILNLFDPASYQFIMRSFLEQFGPFLFFFIAGCIVLITNREFTSLLCYLSLIVVILAFHLVDYKVYAGYSRFNLFVLPPILAGSSRFVLWLTERKRFVGTMLAFATIASNLLLSPVRLDGVKEAYWGNYLIDTSEHYYPYQEALIWLKNNYPDKRMLFTGLDFYYPFQFYWSKLDWKPKRDGLRSDELTEDERLAIASLLQKAESDHYDVVVYRVLKENLVPPAETGEFRVQVIKNSVHTLFIFYKP